MPLIFDATIKEPAQASPRDFVSTFDAPASDPVTVLNVDLSALTTSADLVFGIGEPLREVLHVEGQTDPDEDKHCDVLVCNALLHKRYRVPVHSIVLLLRSQAQHRNLNGTMRYEARPGRGKLDFGYEVVRLWEWPAETLLAGGLELLPLAPLCKLPEGVPLEEGLAGVVRRVVERLEQDAQPEQAKKLATAAFILTGLRVTRARAKVLFQGVRLMHDSDTYQAILDEGEVRGLQNALLVQGEERFGRPDEDTRTALQGIDDLERLRGLMRRVLKANTWQELLQSS
ncbi:MAG: hypothetical protein L0Z62_33035 [Gemmataceae bacterium]|nr:hypothetical protein [Gemmataceae bacterium]